MTTQIPDPRPDYARATDWVIDLAAAVPAHLLDAPTPSGYDVRTLLGHLVATADRFRVIGEGDDPDTQPVVVTGPADDGWSDAYAAATAKARAVWSDAALLDTALVAPWGTAPGRVAVWAYVNETLVHGWDLAVATGQPSEFDAAVALRVLAEMPRILPAEVRGGPMPFAAVVESAPDAGATERLANWSGHARP